jgi:hypothetical protein
MSIAGSALPDRSVLRANAAFRPDAARATIGA